MKLNFLCGVLALALVSVVPIFSDAAQRQRAKPRPAKICSNPNAMCRTTATFEAHDLPFLLDANAVIYETELFYAIILKSIRVPEGNCETFIPEAERLKAQMLFPDNKVFSSRCADPGTLYYTNTAPDTQFMAVYAGATRAEAARMLSTVRATGQFPGANIRRMRAGFNGT